MGRPSWDLLAEESGSTFEPEIELIIAVFRRAMLDAVFGKNSTRRLAEWFLRDEGFDLDAIRQAWAGKKAQGWRSGVHQRYN